MNVELYLKEMGQRIMERRKKLGLTRVTYDIWQAPRIQGQIWKTFLGGGYYVETVGQVDEDAAKKYIEEQEECSRIEG